MKRSTMASALICALLVVFMAGAMPSKNAIKKKGSTYIVNTTSITKKIHGYAGATPLNIYITNNKITRIETLPNQESPNSLSGQEHYLTNLSAKTLQKFHPCK